MGFVQIYEPLESWCASEFDQYELISITNTTYDERHAMGSSMNNAQVVSKKLSSGSDQIQIDYLCFTFALKNLTYCHKALGEPLPKGKGKRFAPTKRNPCCNAAFVRPSSLLHLSLTRLWLVLMTTLRPTTKRFVMCISNTLNTCLRVFTNQGAWSVYVCASWFGFPVLQRFDETHLTKR